MASGATVIVTSSSDNKLEIAKKLAAHYLINYVKTPERHIEVLKIANDRGVDYIIEAGGRGTLDKYLQATRRSGFISIVGALNLVCILYIITQSRYTPLDVTTSADNNE